MCYDQQTRYGIRDDFKLRRLSAQLFASVANQASSYRLSKDLEVSPDTVLQYFNYIEDAFLGFFVPKFSQIYYWQEDKEVDFVVKEKEQISYLVNASVSIKQESTRNREIESLMAGMHTLQKSESMLVLVAFKWQIIKLSTSQHTTCMYMQIDV